MYVLKKDFEANLYFKEKIMKKRILRCLSGGFLVSTVTTAVGTQQTSAISGNPATPIQKEEIAEYCYKEVKKYWEFHDPIPALKKKFNLIEQSAAPNWVKSEYIRYFENNDLLTFDNELKLDEKLYKEALKDSSKEWNCAVLAGHMSNYLKSNNIKHVYISFVPDNAEGHAAIMYAVNEPSKSNPKKMEENWYILDMARMLDMQLTSGKYGKKGEIVLKEGTFNELWDLDNKSTIKSAKDAAAIPLIEYAEWKYGFHEAGVVFVNDPDSTQRISPEKFIVYDSNTLGEFLVENSPDFAKKYLILEAAGIDEKNLQLNNKKERVPNSRRLMEKEDAKCKPALYRTFNMVVKVGANFFTVPYFREGYDDVIYKDWVQNCAKANSKKHTEPDNDALYVDQVQTHANSK